MNEQSGHTTTGEATNVVLVHGAWADGSSWSGVIPLLLDAGYQVTAVQLPLTGLSDDVAAARRVLARQEGPTVLVGHSYGGAVISGASTDAPGVTGLVFVSAYAPDEGETLLDLNGRFPATEGVAAVRPDEAGMAWLDPAAFPRVFAADVEPLYARVMAAVQKPIAGAAFGAGASRPGWRTLPTWFLISGEDRMINPDQQRWMAQRIGATVRETAASHASLVSQPQAVVDLIAAAGRPARG